MSSTDGPNTASTGSMSSTYARVQAIPAVQKIEILGVLRVSRVLNPEILQHSSKILRVILQPAVPRNEKPWNTASNTAPRSMKSRNTPSIESISSTKCRNTASTQKYEQYWILKYFKYGQYSRVSNPEILQVQL